MAKSGKVIYVIILCLQSSLVHHYDHSHNVCEKDGKEGQLL